MASSACRWLRYKAQDSRQTLAEGLAEYYAANVGRVLRPTDLPPDSAALFRRHDVCHVIFGLDTTLADETVTDARTMVSCDVGWRRYTAYLATDAQAKTIFAGVGWWTVTRTTLLCLPRILRACLQAARMTKRWPWEIPEAYLGRTLVDLRGEFGIRVI